MPTHPSLCRSICPMQACMPAHPVISALCPPCRNLACLLSHLLTWRSSTHDTSLHPFPRVACTLPPVQRSYVYPSVRTSEHQSIRLPGPPSRLLERLPVCFPFPSIHPITRRPSTCLYLPACCQLLARTPNVRLSVDMPPVSTYTYFIISKIHKNIYINTDEMECKHFN